MCSLIVKYDSDNGLEQHEFRFWLTNDVALQLDRYTHSARQSKRHKYAIVKFYDRLFKHSHLSFNDVPFKDFDAFNDAKKQIIDAISFAQD